MEYRLVLLTLVLLWRSAHGSRGETELCYIKGLDSNTDVCNKTENVLCCHGKDLTDINITVYREADCVSVSQCGTGSGGCCSKTTEINITIEYRRALKKSFISTKCFSEVINTNILSSSIPNSTGLDLVVVSFNCPDMANKKTTLPTTLSTQTETTTTSPTTVSTRTDMANMASRLSMTLSTRADTTTTSPTTVPTRTDDGGAAPIVVREDDGTAAPGVEEEDDGTAAPGVEEEGSSSNVAAAVAVPVAIVVIGAVVVGTIFYVRRRRSRKDATEQRLEIHTNNAYIGLVSRSMGVYPTAHPTIKAEDQDTNHYYSEIADNSDHFNHSSTEDNEYQPIKPNERTANNGPPTNSFTTDKGPTGEDEYDHLGTQDTPSSRANNYEHITHISKDDCHSYDKTEFNQGNTISLDDEDNYNHAQQSAATERTETDDRDGGYSHVDGTVGGPEADDQYSTVESVMDTQDGSRHLNNYFVLEKQY